MHREGIIVKETLHVDIGWNEEDAGYVRKNLVDYNKQKIAYTDVEKVSVILKDDDEQIVGGILGHVDWNCLHIEILWVDDSLRGQGQGANLLKIAEKVALDKGCNLMKLDTFSFQAPDFYKKLGFEVFGVLKNYPEGFDHYFLYKRIK